MNQINRFVTEDTGAETVEYALVLGLLAVAAVVALTALGTSVSTMFNTAKNSL
jgi:pilus assembly protein Flp/PilA